MNVSLTPELEKLVTRKVASGRFGSASEVVRAALRLLEGEDRVWEAKLIRLRGAVAQGVDELDRGLGRPFDDQAIARLRARGRQILVNNKRRR